MSLSIAKSILSGIPRRGGHQTEWQHAFAVASVAVGLASEIIEEHIESKKGGD